MGKLNILGAFDGIFAAQMPCKHPACTIAVRVRFERIEDGDHKIRVQIIDRDGKPLGPKLDGNISVRFRDDSDSSVVNLVLNIQGLEFKAFGRYRIDLAIDGQMRGSLPFDVREVPKQAGAK
jgi:hypothetical protein